MSIDEKKNIEFLLLLCYTVDNKALEAPKERVNFERKPKMDEKIETLTVRDEIISLAEEMLDEHIEAFLELAK